MKRKQKRISKKTASARRRLRLLDLDHDVSAQTTEKYLGCKQPFKEAVNDHIGIEPPP